MRLGEPGIPRIDVFGCEFEVAAPTSGEECGKKKKGALKSPLTVVLESC